MKLPRRFCCAVPVLETLVSNAWFTCLPRVLREGVGVAELPSGTVTFLFTDLEGSTRLWDEFPDAMQSALARHDEILCGEVVSNGGHVVKTTGDGVHAVFATAHDAVDAAVAAQRALEVPSGERLGRCGFVWACTRVRPSCVTVTTTAAQ